jgi:hypothetical protein
MSILIDHGERIMSSTPRHCKICGRELDNPSDLLSVDCDGDCLQCMADSGDPDSAALVAKIHGEPGTPRTSAK